MLKYFKILIPLLLIYSLANAQEKVDSSSLQAERITNTWERLKPKYIELFNNNILNFINQDSVLRNHFLIGDSSNYKKLELKIIPILKLSYSARNFKFNSDDKICDYFVFDTINYDCVAGLFDGDKLILYSVRGHNITDDYGRLCPGGCEPINWCKGKIIFKQYYYKNSEECNCEYYNYNFNQVPDTIFTFHVDGIGGHVLIIKNDKLFLMPQNDDDPNEYIKQCSINEMYIQGCARFVCPGCVPWWRFWDWFYY